MVIGVIAPGEKGLPGAEGSASGLHDTPYFQLYQATTQLVCTPSKLPEPIAFKLKVTAQMRLVHQSHVDIQGYTLVTMHNSQ